MLSVVPDFFEPANLRVVLHFLFRTPATFVE